LPPVFRGKLSDRLKIPTPDILILFAGRQMNIARPRLAPNQHLGQLRLSGIGIDILHPDQRCLVSKHIAQKPDPWSCPPLFNPVTADRPQPVFPAFFPNKGQTLGIKFALNVNG
jgi:hypothetical protein